jgi:hypothetical protein
MGKGLRKVFFKQREAAGFKPFAGAGDFFECGRMAGRPAVVKTVVLKI